MCCSFPDNGELVMSQIHKNKESYSQPDNTFIHLVYLQCFFDYISLGYMTAHSKNYDPFNLEINGIVQENYQNLIHNHTAAIS